MARPTKKRKSFIQQHKILMIVLASALLASSLILGGAQFHATHHNDNTGIPKLKSRLAYVDGNDAVDQVANFYRQFINPRTPTAIRPKLIEAAGDKNLVFYSQYYQHGFDPITCSTVMPTELTTSLVSTGPVAYVNAVAKLPDSSSLTIKVTVVLSDKLAIDSITCPGAKGDLPPVVSS